VGHDGVIVEGNGSISSSDEQFGTGGQRADSVHPWALLACLVAGAAGYSWIAAGTTPFSAPADFVTALPLGVALLLAAWGVRERRRTPPDMVAAERSGRLWPWAALVAGVAALELMAYFLGLGGMRHAYPTTSSLYDQVANVRPVKAFLVFGWLAIGWALVRP
jgi:hypothetical protein